MDVIMGIIYSPRAQPPSVYSTIDLCIGTVEEQVNSRSYLGDMPRCHARVLHTLHV